MAEVEGYIQRKTMLYRTGVEYPENEGRVIYARDFAANAASINLSVLPKPGDEIGPVPFCGVRLEEDFIVFLLNTSWQCSHDQSIPHGKLSTEQLQWFKKASEKYRDDKKLKIVLIHHHPMQYSFPTPTHDVSMIEEGSELVEIAAQNGINLIMHGHRHHPRALTRLENGWKSPITFICAGSLSVNAKHRAFGEINMPRRWYCKLPSLLSEILRPGDKAFFWYSEGSYPDDYTQYPRAGIQSFVPFSGTASLRTESKRTHIIVLSYDKVRTEGTLSILDPEAFITCNAYDSSTREIHENVLEINESIISRAILSVSLHMDDFFFMLSKLCELANEFLPIGDVILVPDGPKPLIFAISLVPELLNKPGVTCLHIMRNKMEDKPLDVLPNQKVIGFAISKDI